MTIFKPKEGPVFTTARMLHFAEAFGVTTAGGVVGGYQGMVVLAATSIIGGFLWEVSNKWLPGPHKFGDAIDFLAFIVGSLLSCIGQIAIGQ